MKKFIYIFLALATVACKVGPKMSSIETSSNEEFRFKTASTDSVLNLKWWEIFNDPDLETLINIGLAENKNVLIASKRIEQYRAEFGYKKADLYPTIGLEGGVTHGNFNSFQTESSTTALYGGAKLNWEIDFWGKYRNANDAAKLELLASEYGKRTVQLDLITEITKNYFLLVDYRARLTISQNTLASRDSSQNIIDARFKNGIVPELDLNQAQIQTSIAKAAVPEYERLIALTENKLSSLLGHNPEAIITINSLITEIPNPPAIPEGIPSSLLTRRPDLLAKEQQVYAQNALVGVAVAQRYPSISLTGFFGGVNDQLKLFNSPVSSITGPAWNVGSSLFMPLINFGKNKKRVEIEKIKTEQVVLEYEQSVIDAFREVEDALISISTYEKELVAVKEQVDAAKNAKLLSELRYDKGVTSYLEVIEYQRTNFEAELRHSKTKQQYLSSYILLYKALGGGWITREEEQQQAE